MKPTIIASLLACITLSTSLAQDNYFEDIKWKLRETDHFKIYAHETDHAPAKKLGEKVFKLVSISLPALKTDFEMNEFETPTGKKPVIDYAFKLSIYLTGHGDAFDKMTKKVAESGRDVTLSREIGYLGDYENR